MSKKINEEEKRLREMGFQPKKFNLKDAFKKETKREIVKKIIVGDLFFCNRCYNIHRPGPHKNLGINYDDFADIIRMCRDSTTSEKEVAKKFAKLITEINCNEIVDDNGLLKPVLIEPSISSAHTPIGGGGFCYKCYSVHSCGNRCDVHGFLLSEYALSNKEDLKKRYEHINPDVLNYVFLTQSEYIRIFQMKDEIIDAIYSCPAGHYHYLTEPPCKRFNESYRQWKSSASLDMGSFFSESIPGIKPK